VVSPRARTPEVIAAYERFRAGGLCTTPELAVAALLSEMRHVSAQLDHQAHLILTSRSWRLIQFVGLGAGDDGSDHGNENRLEKLWRWAALHSGSWDAAAPLRLFNRLLRRGRPDS
jgi:hypothetical protein